MNIIYRNTGKFGTHEFFKYLFEECQLSQKRINSTRKTIKPHKKSNDLKEFKRKINFQTMQYGENNT